MIFECDIFGAVMINWLKHCIIYLKQIGVNMLGDNTVGNNDVNGENLGYFCVFRVAAGNCQSNRINLICFSTVNPHFYLPLMRAR